MAPSPSCAALAQFMSTLLPNNTLPQNCCRWQSSPLPFPSVMQSLPLKPGLYVTCDGNNVAEIYIDGSNPSYALTGNIASSGFPNQLSQLRVFAVFNHPNLTGAFPDVEIPLIYLDVSNNSLAGSLPASLSSAPLRYIDFSHNPISGDIPWDIPASFPTLQSIDLSNTFISDSLPDLTSMKGLTSCNFSNSFVCIPPGFTASLCTQNVLPCVGTSSNTPDNNPAANPQPTQTNTPQDNHSQNNIISWPNSATIAISITSFFLVAICSLLVYKHFSAKKQLAQPADAPKNNSNPDDPNPESADSPDQDNLKLNPFLFRHPWIYAAARNTDESSAVRPWSKPNTNESIESQNINLNQSTIWIDPSILPSLYQSNSSRFYSSPPPPHIVLVRRPSMSASVSSMGSEPAHPAILSSSNSVRSSSSNTNRQSGAQLKITQLPDTTTNDTNSNQLASSLQQNASNATLVTPDASPASVTALPHGSPLRRSHSFSHRPSEPNQITNLDNIATTITHLLSIPVPELVSSPQTIDPYIRVLRILMRCDNVDVETREICMSRVDELMRFRSNMAIDLDGIDE